MMRILLPVLPVSSFPGGLAVAQRVDTDADGLPDASEKMLGTDPAPAESLVQTATDKTRDEGDRAPTEAAAFLSLKAGPHALPLANLSGGSALDQIILVPAR